MVCGGIQDIDEREKTHKWRMTENKDRKEKVIELKKYDKEKEEKERVKDERERERERVERIRVKIRVQEERKSKWRKIRGRKQEEGRKKEGAGNDFWSHAERATILGDSSFLGTLE